MTRRNARLELTWQNKDRRLLSHGADTYEWVDPADWRVSEVRLLHPAGEVGSQKKGQGNLLIQGDALHALNALVETPELRKEYLGKVKLCYIDPPFNTGQTFAQYDDAVEHSVWLTMLRDRLTQIKKLLADDGSVWLHLDDAEAHRARCVLDEVFGAENFVATVIWQRVDNARQRITTGIAPSHDFILVYRKTDKFQARQEANTEVPKHFDKTDEDGRHYCVRTLRKTGSSSRREDVPTAWFPIDAPDGSTVWPVASDGSESRWRWGADKVKRDYAEIEWVPDRSGKLQPFTRIYFDEDGSTPFTTWWPYGEVGSNRIAKLEMRSLFPGQTPFATPKPERLLERIIHIGSNPGDIVLDCFAGSGTTAAVAHKMGRRWVTVELSEDTVRDFVEPRLERVIAGEDPGGITEAVGWTGGGGYSKYVVGPSMFEDVDGVVALADWVTGGELGTAVAAQLGYELMDQPPFVGLKGRSRLAVIDGMATTGIVDYLMAHLVEGERLHLVAQALEPGLADYVKSKRPGSKAQKVPKDLAHVSRRTATVTLQTETKGGGKKK